MIGRQTETLRRRGTVLVSSVHQNLLAHWRLSESDRAIIAHLQDDGRRPFVTIARALGLSEKTVRHRVHHLLEAKIIQIVALTNPAALGYHAQALVGLTSDPAVAASEIARALTLIEDVDYVVISAGRYNLFAEIISRDLASLKRAVEREIGAIAGVKSVEIFLYFSVYYQKPKFFNRNESPAPNPGVKHKELDSVDRRIASELGRDGRMPFKEVALRLGLSETLVRTRVNSMIGAGQMNILAIINPMNLEDHAIAWLGIKAATGTPRQALAEEISRIPEVSYIAICAGRYDFFVEVVCSSKQQLLHVSTVGIGQIPGVSEVESFFYIDLHYKRLMPARG